MAVPPFREMLEPLIRVLADAPQGLTSRQAQDLVAVRLQLSSEDRAHRVPGGTQVLFRHRTNWAHDLLKRTQLSSTLRGTVWQLTDEGRRVARSDDGNVPNQKIKEIARAVHEMRLSPRMTNDSPEREPGELRA